MYKKYGDYRALVIRNRIKNFFFRKKEVKYMFILSPPYSGSTLLAEILSTSKNVSINNKRGTREGQQLPTVRSIMFDNPQKWNIKFKYDWDFIKSEWAKYWDKSKSILLEKSPPNLIRAKEISEIFQPAYFIVLYRNPYALCESLMRRNKFTAQEAAEFVLMCFEYQARNAENLDNAIKVSYEELTSDTSKLKDKLVHLVPELKDIVIPEIFDYSESNYKELNIINRNKIKLENLTKQDILIINKVLEKEIEMMHYFSYSLEY